VGFAEAQCPKTAGLLLALLLSWFCPERLRQEVRAPLGSQSHHTAPVSQGFTPGFSYFIYVLEQENDKQVQDKAKCAEGC